MSLYNYIAWYSMLPLFSHVSLSLYIYSPVNLVQSTPERWVYVLMFGSLSGVLLLSIVTNGFAVANSGNESIAGARMYIF